MEKRAKGRTLMSYAPDIKVVDCTLRDGGLVNDFYFTDEFVKGLWRCFTKGLKGMLRGI